MYWTLELASKLEDAPWPATKEELIDYAIRSGSPLEVLESAYSQVTATLASQLMDEVMKLTPVEFGILAFLMKEPGRVYSIEQIYENVWNEPSFSPENTVSVHIRRIREKIEIKPKDPKYLKVVWGIGYKIEKI